MSDKNTDVGALSFEDALTELEQIVRGLESGQQKLEDAITAYERGAALRRHCEAKLAQAEARAVAAGCHSAWLDTFQARGFYLALGYQEFGALNDYPPGQTRYFFCKRLAAAPDGCPSV